MPRRRTHRSSSNLQLHWLSMTLASYDLLVGNICTERPTASLSILRLSLNPHRCAQAFSPAAITFKAQPQKALKRAAAKLNSTVTKNLSRAQLRSEGDLRTRFDGAPILIIMCLGLCLTWTLSASSANTVSNAGSVAECVPAARFSPHVGHHTRRHRHEGRADVQA